MDFQNLLTIEFCWRLIFLNFENSETFPTFGPDRNNRFDVYWAQTDRHPDRKAKHIYTLYMKYSGVHLRDLYSSILYIQNTGLYCT